MLIKCAHVYKWSFLTAPVVDLEQWQWEATACSTCLWGKWSQNSNSFFALLVSGCLSLKLNPLIAPMLPSLASLSYLRKMQGETVRREEPWKHVLTDITRPFLWSLCETSSHKVISNKWACQAITDIHKGCTRASLVIAAPGSLQLGLAPPQLSTG